MARLDQSPKTVSIVDLSLDGRGVARWPEGHANAGKAVFVSGALPGETVSVQQTARSRHFDEARTLEVIEASPDRVEPRCPHFGTCGGCVLQHLDAEQQIIAKDRVLGIITIQDFIEALEAAGRSLGFDEAGARRLASTKACT